MTKKKPARSRNPLNMRQLEKGGPFVLSPMPCSSRRREYFQRANRILGAYATITAYSGKGQEAVENAAAANQINDDTPIRFGMGEHTIQTSYRRIRAAFSKAGGQLTNQVFLYVYGNFEAFLTDLCHDALLALGSAEPLQEATSLTVMTRWRGKLDRINEKFGLGLGKRRYVAAYQQLDMGFLGRATTDPIEFLQAMAEFRHRLVHSAGRADAKLLSEYPQSGLKAGEVIELPFGLPFGIHFFFVPLTDLIDGAFATKFGWQRPLTAVEELVDANFPFE